MWDMAIFSKVVYLEVKNILILPIILVSFVSVFVQHEAASVSSLLITLPCIAFSRPRSEGRPHIWIAVLHADLLSTFRILSLQASVRSMKWHCLSMLFLAFLFSYTAGQGSFNYDTLFKRFVVASHDMTKLSQLLLLTFASKLLLTSRSCLLQDPRTFVLMVFSRERCN